MTLSASFCREQEALQTEKAASEPLGNRQKIALAAAKAWRSEAILAEKRALRQEGLNKLDTAIALEFADEVVTEEEPAAD